MCKSRYLFCHWQFKVSARHGHGFLFIDSHACQSEFLGEFDITEYRNFCIFRFVKKMGMDFGSSDRLSLQQHRGRGRVSRDMIAANVLKESMVAFGSATDKNLERSIRFWTTQAGP